MDNSKSPHENGKYDMIETACFHNRCSLNHLYEHSNLISSGMGKILDDEGEASPTYEPNQQVIKQQYISVLDDHFSRADDQAPFDQKPQQASNNIVNRPGSNLNFSIENSDNYSIPRQ